MTEVLSHGILGPVNERQAEYGRDIMQASRHLLRLLDDIIVIAAIEVGQLALEPENFSTAELWQEDAAQWRDSAEHHGITLTLPDAVQDNPCHGDLQRLRQALGSIMLAALNGTPQGGGLRLGITQGTEGLSIEIESHSGGLAPIAPSRLFADLQPQPERRHGSANLSLLVARGLIELHGGSVTVQSQETGQTLQIRLPAGGAAIAAPARPN
jgi:signal transduction histidine kinase